MTIQKIQLPKILDIPEKLYPVIFEFNNFTYFLIEGGRGGGKSHSIARIILFICEQRKVRVCCGREIQKTISESVKVLLDDIIRLYNLNFDITRDYIIHRKTGSTIIFKGFREQGQISIKGLEGIDILWIDEAQAITKSTLDIVIPTIRKTNSKIIFTMNRLTRFDPVYTSFISDKDCRHIKINYYDNKFCSEKLINDALKCKEKNPVDYEYIWEGNPLEQSFEYLVSSVKLDKSADLSNLPSQKYRKIKVMSVDLAGQGGDNCVATLIESISNSHWCASKREVWNEPDTDITKGKIINLYSLWKPDILILDADGLGYPIYVSVKNAISSAIAFHGSGQSKRLNAANQRADGYLTLKEFIDNEFLKIPHDDTRAQIEATKKSYKPNGTIFIVKKEDLKKEIGKSPDEADSLMMGVYAINYYSFLLDYSNTNNETVVIDTDFDPYE